MTVIEIENNLNNLIANFKQENFIYEFLLAYGTPKSTIKYLKLFETDEERLEYLFRMYEEMINKEKK